VGNLKNMLDHGNKHEETLERRSIKSPRRREGLLGGRKKGDGEGQTAGTIRKGRNPIYTGAEGKREAPAANKLHHVGSPQSKHRERYTPPRRQGTSRRKSTPIGRSTEYNEVVREAKKETILRARNKK